MFKHFKLSNVTQAVFVLASNHFWKCFSINAGVWLCIENEFSRKKFQLTVKLRPLTWKIFSAKILPSNHSRRCAKRERERERTHTRKHTQRERERERDRKPRKPKIVAPLVRSSNPRSSHREPTNRESHRANRTDKSHRYRSRSRSRPKAHQCRWSHRLDLIAPMISSSSLFPWSFQSLSLPPSLSLTKFVWRVWKFWADLCFFKVYILKFL